MRNPVLKFKARKGHAYLSDEFIWAVTKASPLNKLAKEFEVRDSVLNGWIIKMNRPSKTDPRILKIAEKFNFPVERVFE